MRVGHVIVPVDDLDAALAFYADALGFDLRFRDGDRYAAVHDGTATLALAAPGEQPAPGRTTIGLKVDDVQVAADRLAARGYAVGPLTEGGHELRAAVHDPFGNALVLYGPARPPQ